MSTYPHYCSFWLMLLWHSLHFNQCAFSIWTEWNATTNTNINVPRWLLFHAFQGQHNSLSHWRGGSNLKLAILTNINDTCLGSSIHTCPRMNTTKSWWWLIETDPFHPKQCWPRSRSLYGVTTQITSFVWPTWGPPGSCRPHLGPMLAPWTLLLG